MADRKITSNTALTGALLANNDVFQVVDVSDTTDGATGTNKKMLATEQAIGVVAQVAAGGIPMAKLATDPLARANHTGTQLMATISDAGTLATKSAVASADITDGTIVNADINAAAAIAYAKLNLALGIVNGDVSASAAIAYSKLALTGAILNADLAGSIANTKLATDPLARANHTGTQTASTISDFTATVTTLVAPSEASISANSITSSASQQDLFTALTAAGEYQLMIDLNNLAGGATPDIIELRCFMIPHAAGTARQVGNTVTLVGGLAPKIWWSPEILSPVSYKWTIIRIQGTDRSYAYAIYKR